MHGLGLGDMLGCTENPIRTKRFKVMEMALELMKFRANITPTGAVALAADLYDASKAFYVDAETKWDDRNKELQAKRKARVEAIRKQQDSLRQQMGGLNDLGPGYANSNAVSKIDEVFDLAEAELIKQMETESNT
jgi:plasmid maintenance system antidote protein VapI